ncbi:MAG: hypothetical protein R2713_22625 [Ilumatobacteraceae bacterium]
MTAFSTGDLLGVGTLEVHPFVGHEVVVVEVEHREQTVLEAPVATGGRAAQRLSATRPGRRRRSEADELVALIGHSGAPGEPVGHHVVTAVVHRAVGQLAARG